MNRIHLALFAVTFISTLQVFADEKRPNVVLIMTDNHGAWTLGCYGNPDIRTPNIDRLAAEGTLFDRAFASNPVCSPTRASCLTGTIPSQHGVHSFLAGGRLQTGPDARCTLDELTSIPEVLKGQGYKCGLVGKWHLGGNMSSQEGLDDYWITMPHGGTSTFYDANIIEAGKIRKEPQYLTDFWTAHAVKFIADQAEADDPFFLFLSYNGPYSLSRLLLREGKNRHAAYYADKSLPSFPREPTHPWQFSNRDYINNPISIRRVATEVSGVDDGVGTIMDTLKEKGVDENTLVIFIADQGWVGGHGGFFGMGDHTRPLTATDGMMKIPLIWRQPNRIAAGKRTDQMFANYDLMPTLLGHLGLSDKMPAESKSPGEDFSVVLNQPAATKSKPIFYEYENLRCIRTETAKYTHRHPNGPHELYDLENDPEEFKNLVDDPSWTKQRDELKHQLFSFFGQYARPKYDMWNGGTSQVRIHDGIDEEMAQFASVQSPDLPDGFEPADIRVPEGYTVEMVAGPPLVTHPTLGCFDDDGNLYVCNNAGVNLSNDELEEQLPNAIRRLTDSDGDGHFDRMTVFADKMTFPMGGAWHDGSLYVASPPYIWKLTDSTGDGVADKREIIVRRFGYTGNAASIHGCFFGPDGRLYWCDGYHGHEFKDDDGKVTSQREGSYIFSCLPDGSDVQRLAGGGMDNPVEVDFTDNGDVLGTVNILYTRPRVDCFVHWLHGGAYPHRERVLSEIKTTGDLLGPVHRFGHVAISGTTRYRSGAINHHWKDNFFATFFNHGKVVRLEIEPQQSTYQATQHEFLWSPSRDFHPTDVIEDADGSLLVVDTGGWFYRGCPTSQFAKPDLLGAIYRVRRTGMTSLVDPRGTRIDWESQTAIQMTRLLNDTRFAVREQAIAEAVRRGKELIPTLKAYLTRGDIRVRQNCLWALARLAQQKDTAAAASAAMLVGLEDRLPSVRKLACRCLGQSISKVDSNKIIPLLKDDDPSVRREAACTLGKLEAGDAIDELLVAIDNAADRSEEHALIYALIEIDKPARLRAFLKPSISAENPAQTRAALIALDQMNSGKLTEAETTPLARSSQDLVRSAAMDIIRRRTDWSNHTKELLGSWLADETMLLKRREESRVLISRLIADDSVASDIGKLLKKTESGDIRNFLLRSIAKSSGGTFHQSWTPTIRNLLASEDREDVALALDVIAATTDTKANRFADELRELGEDESASSWLRIRAKRAIGTKAGDLIDLITEAIGDETAPSDAMAISRSLPTMGLGDEEIRKIAGHLTSAPAPMLRELIRVFTRTRNPQTIDVFLSAVGQADAFLSLPESELSDVVKRYPKETLGKANLLLNRLKQERQVKKDKLANLMSHLKDGDAVRGQKVFRSEKAKCSSCHKIGDNGKQVGPDLSNIGANRSASDLLESIVLPSASIVRDYGTFQVLTDDGTAVTGLLAREGASTVTIQQSTGELIQIRRDTIEQMKASEVSIMPKGLDEAITVSELADVVAYLRSLK